MQPYVCLARAVFTHYRHGSVLTHCCCGGTSLTNIELVGEQRRSTCFLVWQRESPLTDNSPSVVAQTPVLLASTQSQ